MATSDDAVQLSTADQQARGTAFRVLHEGETFVIPNPWDAGSARILTQLGFAALATTSAGLAFSLGRRDGARLLDRADALGNARSIVAATHLPVSGDLESCYAEAPGGIAETIRQAAAAGLVGCSIEDATGNPAEPVLPIGVAVERVAAAVAAARTLPFPFTLTARAENFLYGRNDLKDTVRRLQAYEEAGADVLYAPGLPDADAIRAVCSSVSRPVNVLAGVSPNLPVPELAACGARRISLGSALARAALGALAQAAQEIRDEGTFSFTGGAISSRELNALMSREEQS
jgi:2-methylisocitrate lyase-like PEP mutase family enzyme